MQVSGRAALAEVVNGVGMFTKFVEIQNRFVVTPEHPYFNQSVYLDNGRLNGALIKEFSNYSSLLRISTADGLLALTTSAVPQTKPNG